MKPNRTPVAAYLDIRRRHDGHELPGQTSRTLQALSRICSKAISVTSLDQTSKPDENNRPKKELSRPLLDLHHLL